MLSAGAKLGPYEILAPLGAGGMGEVYRAHDSKLDRDVALKVLPAGLATDLAALARFEREARAVAQLSHPNILAIHDFGKEGEIAYAVLELLEGETLRKRLEAGALPARKAVEVAVQIADGLAAAHEKGIVHRDVKPENVFLTGQGRVKLLDFGLAKETRPGSALAPTVLAAGPATEAGTILGTVRYMSPEQVRGEAVDHRSDIFSFGAVLYEMLAGRQAFSRDTAAESMTAILKEEPPEIPTTGAGPSPALQRIVQHCLEKKPGERFQSARDVAFALQALSGSAVTTGAATAVERRAAGKWLLAALVIAVVILGAVATWRLMPSTPGPAVRAVTSLARLTHEVGDSEWPSWSPDGSLLAYSSDRSGNSEIYVRRREGGQDVRITDDPAEDVQPAFSPDGGTVAFVSTRSSRTGLIRIGGNFTRVRAYGGDLWVVPALGGPQRRLASDANSPAWLPDGSGILYVNGPENRRAILEVQATGGAVRTLLSSEQSAWEIDRIGCSPDGRWVSLETDLGNILLMPAAGGKPRALVKGLGHAWDAAGRLYVVANEPQGGSRIEVIEVSAAGELMRKEPVTVSLMTAELMQLAVSSDGRRIAVPEREASRNLVRLPLAPGGGAPSGPEEPLTSERETDSYPSISSDGRRIVFASDVLGHNDLSILDIETRRRESLQLPGADLAQQSPSWMPDGRQILFNRLREGSPTAIWVVAVDGSRLEELVRRTSQGAYTSSPSPDGKRLAYVDRVGSVQQVFVVDLATRRTARITDTPGDKFDAVFSPDGRWLAVTAAEHGTVQLFRVSASGGPLQQLTTGAERMRHPIISRDGKWIYIQPSHRNIYRLPAEGGNLEQVTHFPEAGLFVEEPTLSPDGRYLYYCRQRGGASLWLMTLGESGPGS